MEISINTSQLDASLAVNAYKLYKAKSYAEAISPLLDILDMEPRNWQARLFIGACYFKTNQVMAAQRAFRFVYDNCTDAELKQKACLALQAVQSQVLAKQNDIPAEFGGVADRVRPTAGLSLETIIG